MYKEVKMKRWRWVEHIVVGKQGQNRKAWAHLTITSKSLQCFHSVENKVWCWWKKKTPCLQLVALCCGRGGWGQKLVSVKKKNKQNLFLRAVWFLKMLSFVLEKLIAISNCRALLSDVSPRRRAMSQLPTQQWLQGTPQQNTVWQKHAGSFATMTVTCMVRELAVYFVPVRFKGRYSVGGDRLVVSTQANQTDVLLRY